jgi:UDP-N-acetylglucosamine 4,6-dehydratase/5-epimerase
LQKYGIKFAATCIDETFGNVSGGLKQGAVYDGRLVAREEMAKADDAGRYYRIPADNRDLNYDKFFVDGEVKLSEIDDYASHNTDRLSVESIKKMLLSLDYIRDELEQQPLHHLDG